MATVTSDSKSTPQRVADTSAAYDPATFRPQTYFDATARFRSCEDDPRRYLERCLEVIAAREPQVKAWVVLNERGAREQADASAARWRSGNFNSARAYGHRPRRC